MPPLWSKIIARELVVPWSSARMKDIHTVLMGRAAKRRKNHIKKLGPESFCVSCAFLWQQIWPLAIRLFGFQLCGKKLQHICQMSFPIRPAVASGELFVDVRNSGSLKLAVKFAVVLYELIFRAAIKSQRRK